MGIIKFDLPEHWTLEKRHASSLHVVGLDGVAWPCRISRADSQISIQRNRDESGHVFVAFPFHDFGELVVSTGTLPESHTCYSLTLELARGTLNRLRNQLSNWQEGGMEVSALQLQQVERATVGFEQAIFSARLTDAERRASESLDAAMNAIFGLSQAFAEQVTPLRKSQVNVPKFWLGARLGRWHDSAAQTIGSDFEILQFPSPEHIHRHVQNAIVGPLLDASPHGLSQRLQDVDDFDARRSMLIADVREKMGRLPQSVKLIHAVSGLNGTGHRLLSYPQQLQAAIDVLQTIEDSGNKIPTMVSFDSPWSERLAWSVGGVHALQIADSLLRRGVALTMLGLDIHLDYWPNGSLAREPLQWLDLIDLWSQLGLPLVICLRAPFGNPGSSGGAGDVVANLPRGGMDDAARLKLLETVIPMLLARPSVQGIVWQQTLDDDDLRYPGSGLLDAGLIEKAPLQMFRRLRAKFW